MQKIITGDTVVVRSGKYRGKKGTVQQVFNDEKMVVVEGINKIYRHIKPQQRGESGQRIELDGPISLANVALVCPACNKATRVGFEFKKTDDTKKKIRVCRKCNKPVTKQQTQKKKS